MKATLLFLVIAACGGTKPAPAPTKPSSGGATTTTTTAPPKESSLRKDIDALAEQNATQLGAIRMLTNDIQALDDSEDPKAEKRAELQKLHGKREELVKAVTAIRARAKSAVETPEAEPELKTAAQEQLDRAERSLRELDDLKAPLAAIARRL